MKLGDQWDAIRDLSGNELKVLLVLYKRERSNQPCRVNDLAEDARVDRTTIMRLLPKLEDRGYVKWTLTHFGRELAQLLIDIGTASPAVSVMSNADAETDPKSHFATGVNVSPQNATQNEQNATEGSGFATANVKNQPNQSPKRCDLAGMKSDWASDMNRHAKDLATQSANALNDQGSLGYHILVWNAALHADAEMSNHLCEAALMHKLRQLKDRLERTGARQGKAWTASTKAMFANWGIPLSLRRSEDRDK